jgi:hypothetical protein
MGVRPTEPDKTTAMNYLEIVEKQDTIVEETAGEFPPRYVIRDAAFVFSPQPPIEWILDQLISTGSVNLFYGEPGSKKTYALLSLAVCVALGRPWLGFLTITQRVLIIDEESGERRLTLRLAAAIRGEFGDENTPIEFISLAGFSLDNLVDVDELQLLILSRGVGVVIIDALTDVMSGDENSKKDTQPVFTALRKIAETTNVAIILIHHSNKGGSDYRGSSAIKGALDLMVKVESDEDSRFINFKTEKARDVEPTKFAARATWTEDQFYLTEAESQERSKPLSKSKSYVLRFLEENGASPLPDIIGAADQCSANAARLAVYDLVKEKMVYRTNREVRGPGVKAIYDLIEKMNSNVVWCLWNLLVSKWYLLDSILLSVCLL